MTNDDEGEGGVTIPPKIDDVIYEQPLTHNMIFVCNYIRFKQLLNMIGRQLAVVSLNTVLT